MIPKYNIIATNELIVNYTYSSLYINSFEFLDLLLACRIVSTSRDTKCHRSRAFASWLFRFIIAVVHSVSRFFFELYFFLNLDI